MMFSVAMVMCGGVEGNEVITSMAKKTVGVDVVLTVVFATLAVLGMMGTLPQGVGIAFSVVALLQAIPTIAIGAKLLHQRRCSF